MITKQFLVGASADDLWGGYTHTVYPPSSVGTGGFGTTNNNIEIIARKRFITPNYSSLNIYIRWDTTTPGDVPVGSVPFAARIIMSCTSKADDNARAIEGEWFNWSSITSASYVDNVTPTAFTAVPVASITLNQNYTFNLMNPRQNINTAGYTGVRLMINGGEPAGVNQVGFASFDHTTRTEPLLEVDYYEEFNRLAPDAILSMTNLSGTVADIDESPDSPDAAWLTAP